MDIPKDLYTENFDRYFAHCVSSMTDSQKADLPDSLLIKMFTKTGRLRPNKLTFLQKWYVLSQALNKKCFLLVEDWEEGITEDEWRRLLKNKRSDNRNEASQTLLQADAFVLANKDLIHAMMFANRASMSSAYNYFIKLKNREKGFHDIKKEALWYVKMLTNYESVKMRMLKVIGLTVSELYILFYLYDGEKHMAAPIYKDSFRGAPNCSKNSFLTGFKRLRFMGYIEIHGIKRLTQYSITSLGIEAVNKILSNYALNF